MLILDIHDTIKKEKRRFLKKIETEEFTFVRSKFTYKNKVHTIITASQNMLETNEFKRLLKMFKGKVLACDDIRFNEIVEPYRFDVNPYLVEAVISSILNLVSADKSIKTVCIKAGDFKASSKMAELVAVCKTVVFETEPTIELQRFCDECYMNYGAFVTVTECYRNKNEGIFFDTKNIDSEGRGSVLVNGKESLIYPDPHYFICDEKLKELLKYKIPAKALCAAFFAS